MTTMFPAYVLRQQAAAPRATLMEQRRAGLTWRDVERVIAKGLFVLAYQPVVRLSDREVLHHEARLRLHPSAGIPPISPEAFVNAAGEFGLGSELDEAVLEAVQDVPLPTSVNIRGRSLQRPGFPSRVLARLAASRTRVSLELTGCDEIDDLVTVASAVNTLRNAGTLVALDDLDGEGSSLACVRAIEFDVLKISGAILRGALSGERGRNLLATMAQLGRATGAHIVAKHVETLPQAWQAQAAGIGFGQGWLFGAPTPLRQLHLAA